MPVRGVGIEMRDAAFLDIVTKNPE